MKECPSKKELNNYFNNITEPEQKKNIEEHLYGKILSSTEDKDLNIEVESHSGGGCERCLKILTGINEPLNAMLLKYI